MKNTKITKTEFPSYIEELIQLFESGKIKRGELAFIEIEHFDFCSYWIDGRCNCFPAIVNSETGELLNPITD